MMTAAACLTTSPPFRFEGSFADWRSGLIDLGLPPIVAVGGSRGKTTVVRLLDAIFEASGLRTALWTDAGIEINGRHQAGELGPWSRAIARLAQGTLDVAIQELDWATVHTVGLPSSAFPVVLVTNFCANNEACLGQPETTQNARALDRVKNATHPRGRVVLNGDDFSVGGGPSHPAASILVGASRDTPLLRSHLASGGVAAWVEDGKAVLGSEDAVATLTALDGVDLTSNGAVGFQQQNVLLAAAAAAACGIAVSTIGRALRRFVPPDRRMPGSFNVLPIGEATVVVDRPAPSWFLRTALRAIAHLPHRRLLTVAGHLDAVPPSDLVEVGRLLGRSSGILILHSEADRSSRFALLRRGIAANDVPPGILHVGSERIAVGRALRMLQPNDLAFIVADQPATVLRALERAEHRLGGADHPPFSSR